MNATTDRVTALDIEFALAYEEEQRQWCAVNCEFWPCGTAMQAKCEGATMYDCMGEG